MNWKILTQIYSFSVGTLGAILFSQGVSFARSRQPGPVSDLLNFHAALIAISGVALALSGGMFFALRLKISQLETEIAQMKNENNGSR